MARRELISGPNFSGRSAALMALLRDGALAPETFYIGPYSEAALSGLSSTIADEIDIYRAKPESRASLGHAAFSPLDFAALARREPQTLSGGEQVLLALHCFSLSAYSALAIDTALEQLDRDNRDAALTYLDPRKELVATAALIDNWLAHDRTCGRHRRIRLRPARPRRRACAPAGTRHRDPGASFQLSSRAGHLPRRRSFAPRRRRLSARRV